MSIRARIKRSPAGILKAFRDGSQSLAESVRALEIWKDNAVRTARIDAVHLKEPGEGITFGHESQREHRLRLGI